MRPFTIPVKAHSARATCVLQHSGTSREIDSRSAGLRPCPCCLVLPVQFLLDVLQSEPAAAHHEGSCVNQKTQRYAPRPTNIDRSSLTIARLPPCPSCVHPLHASSPVRGCGTRCEREVTGGGRHTGCLYRGRASQKGATHPRPVPSLRSCCLRGEEASWFPEPGPLGEPPEVFM